MVNMFKSAKRSLGAIGFCSSLFAHCLFRMRTARHVVAFRQSGSQPVRRASGEGVTIDTDCRIALQTRS
jgi:hypothetical protein